MNRTGFLCFLIVLTFASLQVRFSENNALNELSEAAAIAVEAEKVNFVRTLLEENSDFLVRGVLGEETLYCDTRPGESKQRINHTLLAYFKEMENCCGISVKFRSSSGKKLSLGFMNRNSAVIIKRVGKSCTMRYSFHGGIMRNEFVTAEIAGKMVSQRFVFPAGYSQHMVGIAVG